MGLATEPVGDRRRQRPNGHEDVDAGRGRLLTELGVELPLLGPQLQHVAEHGDATGAVGGGGSGLEVVEGGAHRDRIGVVAVVDDCYRLGVM